MGRGERSEAGLQTPKRPGTAGSSRGSNAHSRRLVDSTPFTETEISAYCDSLLGSAGVQEDDVVAVTVNYPSQLETARWLAASAARRGCRLEVLIDETAIPQKIENLLTDRAVFIVFVSFSPSEESSGLKLTDRRRDGWRIYDEAKSANTLRWNIAMVPNEDWAQEVYPELSPDAAYRQLGQDLLAFMRRGPEDGPAAWREHLDHLHGRAEKLNALEVHELRFSGGGSDLRMQVLEGARFLPAEWATVSGERVCVNSPTEEVFTTPDPSSVEGTFVASRPLVIGERVMTGVRGRIIAGELVSVECDDPEDSLFLKAVLLDPEKGMNRLGEVGLVDQQGPIARSGRVYFNNIIDENAGTHLGFGNSYEIAMRADQSDRRSNGNTGAVGHLDIVIGQASLGVSAVDGEGNETVLIEDGEWQV